MKVSSNAFIPAAQVALLDDEMRRSVNQATTIAYQKRLNVMFEAGSAHGEAMRQQAAQAKRRALSRLPDLLEQAETNLTANGAHVFWAMDGDEVNRLVLEIIQRHAVKSVVKSKSMVSEEIELNHVLETQGIEVVETDLGEYILQLGNEPPSHIVTPVIHKSLESIRDLFVRELHMPPTDDASEMAQFARRVLREKFLVADMGITGGNFIIAETGTLCLVTNEGNGRLVTSLPRIHLAIVGIEKIVETLEDYATLTQVLPRSATGQTMTVYTHLYNGPRKAGETDGPDEMYVIFVDNGRSEIYGTKYSEVLTCIRCGACMNACPVYRSTGGHAYGWVYPGPVGAVITPLLNGLENAKPLPHASSLCGACKQVCPVDIDLPQMLLDLRDDLYQQGQAEEIWRWGLKLWAFGNQFPALFEFGGRVARLVTGEKPPKHLPGPLAGWFQLPRFSPLRKEIFPSAVAREAGEMSSSRDRILGRLRAAKPSLAAVEPVRGHLPMVPLKDKSRVGLLNQFVEQAEKLASVVHRPASEAEAIQTILDIIGEDTHILSWVYEHIPLTGLAEALETLGIETTEEPDASARIGITGVDAALAATGSLVLATGSGQPRTASLLPPVHIAVVHPGQIVADLETWVAIQREKGLDGFRQTASAMVISGPSRTADIAMQLILGMHGPGELVIIVLST